jgi:hypothetical protein
MKHIHTFENFTSSINENEFWRLPKNAIGNDFYIAQKNLQLIYDAVQNGQDFDIAFFDKTLQILEKIKKQAKKFKNADDIKGTVYEGALALERKDHSDTFNESRGYSLSTNARKDEEYVEVGKILKDNDIKYAWSAEKGILLFNNQSDLKKAETLLKDTNFLD